MTSPLEKPKKPVDVKPDSGIDFAAIRAKLQPPASKDQLISIMAYGMNMPAAVKALAYIAVQRMPQNEIDAIAGLALHAIGYVERRDIEGLEGFLSECQVPQPIADLIITGAKTLAKGDDAKDKAGE